MKHPLHGHTQKYLLSNVSMGLSKLSMLYMEEGGSLEILWKEGGKDITFTQKAVCYFGICEGTEDWKCADDPIESAHNWCEIFGAQEKIEMVDMEPVAHSKAFAFVVTDFTEEWA